ncbi:DDB1- and CUL4-associated factor 8 [Papilio machaon]|uniref:DDB1-and CUL4-associated factor 8 n=1 Tax=Papilio machaon TaxID=76193 RepID=A0A194QNE1_PAPMA|nr:DDB1- and CUL4-associated factor 8 [Papilio machaon]
MEDNSSSDDEVNDSPASRKISGKKLKLNDGSSQNSAKDAAAEGSNNKEEVVDSGISPDKSESTSSEDLLSASGPSNVVVNVGTSDNMVRVMMQNLRHHSRDRNYRKRKTPDSDESSMDSDDFASEVGLPPEDNNGDGDEMQHLLTIISQDSSSSSSNSSGSTSGSSNSSYSNYSFESDNVNFQPMDSSDDDGLWSNSPSINAALMDNNEDLLGNNTEGLFGPPPKVLLKERPKHDYIIVRGHLLASGSDDMNVVVWDWARNRALQTIKTGHRSNVFQSKFLYLNARSQLNIVTCSRDGQVIWPWGVCGNSSFWKRGSNSGRRQQQQHPLHELASPGEIPRPHRRQTSSRSNSKYSLMSVVRLVQCAPSGGSSGAGVARRRLATHARSAHKLHVSAQAPHEVISAGEDGLVLLADVRTDTPTKLVHVRRDGLTVPLYSVDVDCTGNKVLVAGRDRYMHVYDRRRPSAPAASYCPFHIAMVNSIEAHPRFPVLATSGLDRDVKIWVPIKQADPDYEGMEKVIRENSVTLRSPLFNDFLPAIYSAWREDNPQALGRNLDFDGNACTAF